MEKTSQEKDLLIGFNTSSDYIVVRCELVHVKKRMKLFYTEKQLGIRIVIPNSKLDAAKLMAEFLAISDDYAKKHGSKSLEVK